MAQRSLVIFRRTGPRPSFLRFRPRLLELEPRNMLNYGVQWFQFPTAVGLDSDEAMGVTLKLPENEILAGGWGMRSGDTTHDYQLAAFSESGAQQFFVDESFQTPDAWDETGKAVALQGDKLIMVGMVVTDPQLKEQQVGVMRFYVTGPLAGQVDTSFGTGGKFIFTFGNKKDMVGNVAVQDDNKIVIVGKDGLGDDLGSKFAVARLTPNGRMDTAFGPDGNGVSLFVATPGGNNDLQGVGFQPDGQGAQYVVVSGSTNVSGQPDTADTVVARLRSDGFLDAADAQHPGFGGADGGGRDGIDVINFLGTQGSEDRAFNLVIQRDAKIVSTGYTVDPSQNSNKDFAVMRLTPNGDATIFGSRWPGHTATP
jgi:uncharacterized delta-60 repeat protein